MKNRKRKWTGLLLAVVCMFTMMLAVPVSAEITEDTEEMLQQNVHDYLSSIFGLEDSIYDQVRASGGFYEIMVDAIRENQDTVGAMVSVGDVKVAATDTAVTCTTEVEFENYDVDVVMTFDAAGSAPTNFVMNIDYPLSVKMGQAGMNTLTGILVVFVILLFLAGVISLFGFINKGVKKEKAEPTKMPVKDMAPVRATVEETPAKAVKGTDDIELAIVLAAAIAAAEEEQPSGDGYVVRSIKKVNTSRRWRRV